MEQFAQFFKALSDQTRLRIIVLLMQSELCVCDLMFVLGEPQSKVSRHLAFLKHSGLTISKRDGVWMHYSLREPAYDVLRAQLNFLKEKFSDLPQFREDQEKLLELKRQGGCRAMMKFKAARWSRQRPAGTKDVSPMMEIDPIGNSNRCVLSPYSGERALSNGSRPSKGPLLTEQEQ